MLRKLSLVLWPVALLAVWGGLLVWGVWPTTAVSSAPTQSSTAIPGITDITHTPDGVRFILNTPTVAFDPESGQLTAVGLEGRLTQLGAPDLPYYHTAVAVPTGHTIHVNLKPMGQSHISQAYVPPFGQEILPYELLDSTPQESNNLTDVGTVLRSEDPAVYGLDGLYPAEVWENTAVSNYQGAGIVNLSLYPIRYNPGRGELHHTPQLEVDIRFVPQNGIGTPAPAPLTNLPRLEGIVLNPASAAPYQAPSLGAFDLSASQNNPIRLPIGQPVLKIQLDQDGIYEISPAEVAAAGITTPLNKASLQLMTNGESVAYQFIDSNGNALFDGDDRLRFYGAAWQGSRAQRFFITDNIYWLWDNGTPSLMTTVASVNTTAVVTQTFTSQTFEEDQIAFLTRMGAFHWNLSPNEPDAWFWRSLGQTGRHSTPPSPSN
jgi:hypothetical protein